jgi:hypothetical protein
MGGTNMEDQINGRSPGPVEVSRQSKNYAPLYKNRPEAEVARLVHESGEKEYVLTATKFRTADGVFYKKGEHVPLLPHDAQRLLTAWAVDVPGSKRARRAMIEATGDEGERRRLQIEGLQEKIRELRQEQERLERGDDA